MFVAALAACLPAVLPAGMAIVRAAVDAGAWRDVPMTGVRWGLLARSGVVALIVGVAATAMGWWMAQVLRRRPGWAAVLIAPMWIPAWLTYAGLNLARAPDTVLGAAFMEWALPDHRWAIVWLGRTVAVGSMALWAAPLAALVMAGVREPLADAGEELLRLERGGVFRRVVARVRMRRRAVGASLIACGLVTLGSAVPLHLAQVETDAITLWRALAERTPDRWGGVWLGAWPELLMAVGGSWWLVSVFGPGGRAGEGIEPVSVARPGWGVLLAAWSVWGVAALLPGVLMAASLDEVASLWHWLRMNGGALGSTAAVSGAGALAVAVAAVGVAALSASESGVARRAGALLAGCGVFGFLLPGVFTGVGVARLGLDPAAASVVASAARGLIVGAVGGLIAARCETPEERAMRRLDRMGDAWGWVRVHPARAVRLGAGAWLGAFVLGLSEIEASVQVRAPGSGNLPQQMLSDLHYARLEQLSAGGVVLGVLAVGLGGVAALALGGIGRQPGGNGAVPHSV